MCAIEAGKRGRRVVLLERAEKIGKKILISGGGRCNFTNLHTQPKNFLSENPHFAKSALARYTPADFIALVEKHGISYHEKTLGQLFCDNSATQIITMLESECRYSNVKIVVDANVTEVRRDTAFTVSAEATEYRAPALVVATGGISIPKMGATAFGYDLARQFGLNIITPRPALVPLVFHPADRKRYSDLAGVSTEIIASAGKSAFREKMLFTHRGLSGPAILQASSYLKEGEALQIDLAPGRARSIPKRRSPRRRRGPRRTLQQNHGIPQSSRPLLHRRSRRRHRPPRRLQFSMGLGLSRRCRPRSLILSARAKLSLLRCNPHHQTNVLALFMQ